MQAVYFSPASIFIFWTLVGLILSVNLLAPAVAFREGVLSAILPVYIVSVTDHFYAAGLWPSVFSAAVPISVGKS